MTAKYVFHLETGAELQTQENIHHKWDLTNNTNNNSVILDGSFPLLSTIAAKLDSKVGTDLEDTDSIHDGDFGTQAFFLVCNGCCYNKVKLTWG